MATISILVALEPILVMEGAMKPMTIRGTQNMMTWLSTYFRVTTTVMALSGRNRPKTMPTAMPMSSFRGRLMPLFSVAIMIILPFDHNTQYEALRRGRYFSIRTAEPGHAYAAENRGDGLTPGAAGRS